MFAVQTTHVVSKPDVVRQIVSSTRFLTKSDKGFRSPEKAKITLSIYDANNRTSRDDVIWFTFARRRCDAGEIWAVIPARRVGAYKTWIIFLRFRTA